jgi:hypothetical protein
MAYFYALIWKTQRWPVLYLLYSTMLNRESFVEFKVKSLFNDFCNLFTGDIYVFTIFYLVIYV